MKREKNMFLRSFKKRNNGKAWLFFLLMPALLSGCDLIKMKKEQSGGDRERQPVARVNETYLYRDELIGLVVQGISKEDSTSRVETYIDSWIRKQLLIQEATEKI